MSRCHFASSFLQYEFFDGRISSTRYINYENILKITKRLEHISIDVKKNGGTCDIKIQRDKIDEVYENLNNMVLKYKQDKYTATVLNQIYASVAIYDISNSLKSLQFSVGGPEYEKAENDFAENSNSNQKEKE